MDRFTIDQLSHLAGLPTQTIIYWKKKYNAYGDLNEKFNTETRYSTTDLQRILNISTLFHLNKKYPLDSICAWNDEQLATKVEIELLTNFLKNDDIINQLIASCLTYNESRFRLIIDATMMKLCNKEFYEKILYPFLKRIYSTFSDKNEKAAQFYYMKYMIKQKFYSLIDKNSNYVTKQSSILLFLPENEFNEIGLLFCNLILLENGYKTYYLGANQKNKSIGQAINDIKPSYLVTYIPTNENIKSFKETIKNINDFDKQTILFGSKTIVKQFKYIPCIKAQDLNEFYECLNEFEIKKGS